MKDETYRILEAVSIEKKKGMCVLVKLGTDRVHDAESYIDIQSVLRTLALAPQYTKLSKCAAATIPEALSVLARCVLFGRQEQKAMKSDREELDKDLIEVQNIYFMLNFLYLVFRHRG